MTETPTLPKIPPVASPLDSDPPAFGDITVSDADLTTRPATKRRRTSRATTLTLIIAIGANLAPLTVILSHAESAPATPARAQPPTSPTSPALPDATPGATATSFGEGRFVVGTDIAPGTYRTTGKSGRQDCYWERLTDINGTTSIIANDLAPGPLTVTIGKTDAVFQTRWCNTWTKVG